MIISQDNQQKAKGYGFVTFEEVQAAMDCLNFDNHVFDNKPIAVKVSLTLITLKLARMLNKHED